MTATERKNSEFVKDKIGPKKDLLNQTMGNIKRTDIEEKKPSEKPSKEMTATERKLKTIYPDMSLSEMEKLRKSVIVKENEEIPPEKDCKNNILIKVQRNKSTKQIRVDTMYSNIFHDPNKPKQIKAAVSKNEETQKVKEEKKSTLPPKVLNKTKTSAKFDWKSNNTEILFKGERDANSGNLTAKAKKMGNLRSAFDTNEKSFVEFDKSVLKTDLNEKIDSEIHEKMKENTTDSNKLNRTFHGMSAMHDKEFYKKSFGSKNFYLIF